MSRSRRLSVTSKVTSGGGPSLFREWMHKPELQLSWPVLVPSRSGKAAQMGHALGISDVRRARWCRGVDADFLAKIEKDRPSSLEEMNRAWYGYHNNSPHHYDSTRYRGVNLHNVWFRGTVEYRWFESTLHAGKVKAYIQFALALSAKAINARASSSRRRDFNPATAKYDFRVFLLKLGLIGDEFKTARLHLLARLNGSAAWKGERRDTVAYQEANG